MSMSASSPHLLSLIETKLQPPQPPATMVDRPHHVERLTRGVERRLTLLSAPTGFGKTTLVQGWLRGIDHPAAWLSLDPSDDSVTTFFRYLCGAVREVFPETCGSLIARLVAPQPPLLDDLLLTLINDLSALPERLLLVLDDFHTIRDADVHALLQRLIHHLPRSVHLVIITRADPPFPLARLRAQGQLTELRAIDLRFSLEESRQLLGLMPDVVLSAEDVEKLHEVSEGWIAAFRLAAQSLQQPTEHARATRPLERAIDPYTMQLLVEEVLLQQSEPVQDFLLQSSILDSLSAPLCAAVVGRETARDLLAQAVQQNLFLTPIDPHGRWYRYHPLFRSFLTERLLATHTKSTIGALHSRACEWFARQHLVNEALTHALAAGIPSRVADLVADHGYRAVAEEKWEQLATWLQTLPHQTIDQRIELLLLRIWQLDHRGQDDELLAELDRLETLLERLETPPPTQLRGEITLRRSHRAYLGGQSDAALVLARQALDETSPSQHHVRARARVLLARALQSSGDIVAAESALYHSLREEQRPTAPTALRTHLAQAQLLWREGDLHEMNPLLHHVTTLSTEGCWVEGSNWAQYLLGAVAYMQDDLSTAEGYFSHVWTQARSGDEMILQSGIGLGLIYQARGQAERASEVAEKITERLLEGGSTSRLQCARSFRAHLALVQGHLTDAARGAESDFVDVPFCDRPSLFEEELGVARVLIARRAYSDAQAYLARRYEYQERVRNRRVLIEILALRALVCDAQGQREGALAHLGRSLLLAEPGGFVRPFVDLGTPMAVLLHELARRTDASYSRRLLTAITEAHHGQSLRSQARSKGQRALIEPLTERELEVLDLLQERLTNKEIARHLIVSPLTIKKHVSNICQKLNATNRRQAVVKSQELGLLPEALPTYPTS